MGKSGKGEIKVGLVKWHFNTIISANRHKYFESNSNYINGIDTVLNSTLLLKCKIGINFSVVYLWKLDNNISLYTYRCIQPFEVAIKYKMGKTTNGQYII